MTCYKNYLQLQHFEKEGEDYQIFFLQRNSGILIMAPHGGCIEPGTTEIAIAAAGKEHSVYCFEGMKNRDNHTLHITSTHFDEPTGSRLAGKAQSIIALHGCRDEKKIIYLGGRDAALSEEIRNRLEQIGVQVGENPRFPGLHTNNICNRSLRGMGVQMEISLALRQCMFEDLKRDRRDPKGELFHNIIQAVRLAISDYLNAAQDVFSEFYPILHQHHFLLKTNATNPLHKKPV